MSESLGTAVLELDANQGPLDRKLDATQAATEGRLSSISKKVKAAGTSLSSASSTLTRRITVPILAIGALTGKMAVDFEKAMRNVNSIAQLPEPAFQKLNESVLEMAGRTAQAPQTLAEGLYDLVSSGFDAKDSMVILEASAKAATAGLTTTEVSTKAVAAALNAYHLPASQAGAVSDTLFETVNRGVVTFEELASSIGLVLPAASTMGVDLKEVGASIATLTKEGQSGSMAVTNINAAMTAFIKPSKSMTALLGELGYETSQQLIKQKGFQGALELVTGAVHGNREEIGKLFPNVRAMRAVFGLTGASAKTAAADVRAFQDDTGATSKVLAEQKKSVAYQWNQLKAELSRLAIEIGKALIPAVVPVFRKIADAISTVGKAFTNASPSVQHFIIMALGIAAAIGPALGLIGGLVEIVGLLVSPVAAVVVGVGLLVAAFIHLYTTSSNVHEAVSNVVNLFASIGTALIPVGTALGGVALKIAAFGLALAGSKVGVMLLGAAVGALIGRMIALGVVWAVEKVAAFVAAIGSMIAEVRMAVEAVGALRAASMALSATIDGALVSTGIGALLVVAGSVVGALMGMSSASDHAKTSADQLTQSLQSQADAMREVQDIGLEEAQAKVNLTAANLGVARAEKRLVELRQQGQHGTLTYREAENQLAQARIQQKRAGKEVARSDEEAHEKRQRLSAATREAVKAGQERIKTLGEEKAEVAASIVKDGDSAEKRKQLTTINRGLRRTHEEIAEALGKVPKKADAAASSLNKIPKKKSVNLEVKDQNTKGKTRSIVSGISGAFKALSPKLASQGSGAINALKSGMAGHVGSVLGLVGSLPGMIQGRLSSLPSLLVSAGAALMQGLANGIVSAAQSAAAAAASAAHSVAAAAKGALGIHSPSRVFEEIGHNVIRGLHHGLEGMGDSFADDLNRGLIVPLKEAANNIEKILDGIHHQVASLGEAAQITEEVGNLKIEETREEGDLALERFEEGIESIEAQKKTVDQEIKELKLQAKDKSSPGGAEVTPDEREAIHNKEVESQGFAKTIEGAEGKRHEIEIENRHALKAVERQVRKEIVEALKKLRAEQEREARELPGHIDRLAVEAAADHRSEKKYRAAARKEAKKLRALEHQLQKAKTDAEKKSLREEIRAVSKSKRQAEAAADKAEKLRSKLSDRISELRDRLQELVGATGRGGAIFATLMTLAKLNAIPVSDLPHFAEGVVEFEGGPAEVGEQGPELVGRGIANLAKGVDVLDANMTRRLLSAHRKVAARGGDSPAVEVDGGGVMARLADAIDRLNETGTADVLEALVAAVSERQGYKHLRKRRRTAGDGRVATA